MAELVPLAEAVAELVHDGDMVALEGFTHLIPHAAGHELVRQRRRDLTLVRMTPDVIYDQLIGVGCARKLVFSWGGNPGVGSLHRLRDAVESGWPVPLELDEHSHAGMAAAYAAGAANLPFGVLRGYAGTELAEQTASPPFTCPFTGEELAAVPGAPPRRRHRPRAAGGRGGKRAAVGDRGRAERGRARLAAGDRDGRGDRDRLEQRPGGARPPGWVLDAVSLAPRGAHPSYAHGYYDRDNDFYVEWDEISRDRDDVHGVDGAARARDGRRRRVPRLAGVAA